MYDLEFAYEPERYGYCDFLRGMTRASLEKILKLFDGPLYESFTTEIYQELISLRRDSETGKFATPNTIRLCISMWRKRPYSDASDELYDRAVSDAKKKVEKLFIKQRPQGDLVLPKRILAEIARRLNIPALA